MRVLNRLDSGEFCKDLEYEKVLGEILSAVNRGLIPEELMARIRADYFVNGIVYGNRETSVDPSIIVLPPPKNRHDRADCAGWPYTKIEEK